MVSGWSSILVVIPHSWAAKEDVCSATSEEHTENVIRIELFLSEMLLISLLEALFSTMLIIDLSLLRIIETGKGCTNLLEGICCIGSSILIWMKLQGQFLVSFLDVIFAGTLS